MRKSTGLTKRDGLNHGQNGKGSKTRVTNVKAYRDNYDEINWGTPKQRTMKDLIRLGRLYSEELLREPSERRSLEELRDEYEFRHGL